MEISQICSKSYFIRKKNYKCLIIFQWKYVSILYQKFVKNTSVYCWMNVAPYKPISQNTLVLVRALMLTHLNSLSIKKSWCTVFFCIKRNFLCLCVFAIKIIKKYCEIEFYISTQCAIQNIHQLGLQQGYTIYLHTYLSTYLHTYLYKLPIQSVLGHMSLLESEIKVWKMKNHVTKISCHWLSARFLLQIERKVLTFTSYKLCRNLKVYIYNVHIEETSTEVLLMHIRISSIIKQSYVHFFCKI